MFADLMILNADNRSEYDIPKPKRSYLKSSSAKLPIAPLYSETVLSASIKENAISSIVAVKQTSLKNNWWISYELLSGKYFSND